MPLHSTNPATGELLRSVDTLDEDGLRGKLAQAATAAAQQRGSSVEHRTLCLRKLAALIVEDSEELARTIVLETGKPVRAARDEVTLCADICGYYAEYAARMLVQEALTGGPGQAYVQWEPVGLVLVVLPWDSPLAGVFRRAAPLLAAGNAVSLKHAASVPQCALLTEALVRRAGFRRGALSALLIDDQLIEAALRNDHVAGITVHGTETVGRALAAQAGWLLKKVTLHLGGSDPLIIMPSADLDGAVATAVRALLQGTSNGKRLLVHADVYDTVAPRLVESLEAVRVGDPIKDETELGPLGTVQALAALEEWVDAAVKAGGRVLTGGTRLIGRGNFFEPTLLSDVPPASAVAQEALSGPLAMLFRIDSVQEAIHLANGTSFGAGASIWTQEPSEQQVLLDGITAGTVAVNALPTEHPAYPSGGSKRSCHGRALGQPGLREWMHPKTIQLG